MGSCPDWSVSLSGVARQNGQKPDDEDGSPEGTGSSASFEAPRLTFGQKILVALPEIGRNRGTRPGIASQAQTDDAEKAASNPRPAKPIGNGRAKQPRPTFAAISNDDDSDQADETEHQDAALSEDPDALDDNSHLDDADPVVNAGRPAPMGGLLSGVLRGGGAQKRQGAAVYDDMKTSDLTELMRKLDDKERRFAMLAAPLGGVLAIVLTLITLHNDPVGKGHESTSIITLDGGLSIAFAICLFATAWFRRRSLTAFALLFLGYSLGLIGIGIPFLILGGYLLFRAWRIQKILTSRGVNPRSRQAARPADGRASPRSQTVNQKGKKDTKSGSSRPVQNKRYTPPKPAPKQPAITKAERAAQPEKSSWFERATRSTPAEPN